MNFIKTTDKETADKLERLGFEKLAKEGDMYVFLNNSQAVFSKEDEKKMSFTNILAI